MALNGNNSAAQPRRWWVTAVVVLGAVILLAVVVSHKDDSIPIRTATVSQAKIRSLVSTNGKIEPVANFEAHAPISTSVRHVLVKEGAASFHRQLIKGDLASEYDNEIRLWLEELKELD